jgi:hydrogenase maturation protease
MAHALVLGIGNILLGDDGAGLRALELLRAGWGHDADIDWLDGGTLGFCLAPRIEGAERLLVLDAAQFGEAPGTVRCVRDAEFDRFLGAGPRSVHDVGLRDLFDIARLTGSLPRQRALVGIQPGRIDWGETLSAAVSDALPAAAALAREVLCSWVTAQDRRAS